MLKVLPDAIISILYPQACSICKQSVENREDGVTCRSCWARTRIFSDNDLLCDKCGSFLNENTNVTRTLCRSCDGHYYDSARAVGVYEHALASAVIHLKHFPSVAKRTQKHLLESFARHSSGLNSIIIPVPLSKKRMLERGFNQAEVLARLLSRSCVFDLHVYSLIRTIHTPMHRVAMDGKAREMTVNNAFAVTRPKIIAGKNVLLVDDLYTSGSTVSNCARVLKTNGASSVNVLTLARAV